MLFTPLLSLLAPHECVGCGTEGAVLCRDCRGKLSPAVARCYRCLRPDTTWRTCSACSAESAVAAVYAAARYQGAAKDILWKLKFGRAKAAGKELGEILALSLSRQHLGDVLVTHVPTATSRVRQRGYDQAALIAKAFAAKRGLPYIPLLAREGQHEQVGSSRAKRVKQLEHSFVPLHPAQIRGRTILLIDDVVTTGATLEAAAEALWTSGARYVRAAVFAQA